MNKRRINKILKCVDGYVQYKKFYSGYFIIEFEKNSVCHFKIKSLPHWSFAIWLRPGKDFTIFGQVTILIDKFKPTRSDLCCINMKDFNDGINSILENDGFFDYEEMLCYYDELYEMKKLDEANLRIYNDSMVYITQLEKDNPKLSYDIKVLPQGWTPRYTFEYIGEGEFDNDFYTKVSKDLNMIKEKYSSHWEADGFQVISY